MPTRGIYILANDRVLEHAFTLLNSIRYHEGGIPVILIPYDGNYHKLWQVLQAVYPVQLFPNLDLLYQLDSLVTSTFGTQILRHPQRLRKLAAWWGPYQQFLYLDTDIVLLGKISEVWAALQNANFVCCDYQHRQGIQHVFDPCIQKAHIFTDVELQDIFNGGFWGGNQGAIDWQALVQTLEYTSQHIEYLDLAHHGTEQPINNYLVLRNIPRRINLVRQINWSAGSWAGNRHLRFDGLSGVDLERKQPLHYLHWAGIRIQPRCSYWNVWLAYRHLYPWPSECIHLRPSPLIENIVYTWQQKCWNYLRQKKQKIWQYIQHLNQRLGMH